MEKLFSIHCSLKDIQATEKPRGIFDQIDRDIVLLKTGVSSSTFVCSAGLYILERRQKIEEIFADTTAMGKVYRFDLDMVMIFAGKLPKVLSLSEEHKVLIFLNTKHPTWRYLSVGLNLSLRKNEPMINRILVCQEKPAYWYPPGTKVLIVE